MADFDESLFFPAFKDAGMTVRAMVNGDGPFEVLFHQPDERLGPSVQSRQYQIEYQTADLPTLAEGDSVVMVDTGIEYKVREAPFVDGGQFSTGEPTGYFRKALLTMVPPA